MTYDNFSRHLSELRKEIYIELASPQHTRAARETAEEFLKDLDFKSAVEFGCGVAPTLDILKEWGKKTLGITLDNESVAHEILREDMHFTNLEDKSFDIGISRHSLEHSPIPLIMLMEMKRIVKGYLLVVVPTPTEAMVNHPNHYSVFPNRVWRQLFDILGLKVVRYKKVKYFYSPRQEWDLEYRYLLKI